MLSRHSGVLKEDTMIRALNTVIQRFKTKKIALSKVLLDKAISSSKTILSFSGLY